MFAMCGFAAAAPLPSAGAASSDWVASAGSRVRLLSGGAAPGASGDLLAGVEILLDPGTITYWRTPGDAGVAPRFDTDGSQNVASVTVGYPAPRRLDEAGSEAFGYAGGVVFPMRIRLTDPSRPARLALTLDYAVCAAQCLGATARLALEVGPRSSVESQAAVAAAFDRVPRPEALGVGGTPALIDAAVVADDRLEVAARAGSGASLFVEGPEDWYFEVPPAVPDAGGRVRFEVKAVQRPKGAALAGLPLTLTLVDGDHAVEAKAAAEVAPAR